MKADIEDVLQDIVERLISAAQPEQIILFGSHARGDATPRSDVDLLVIEAQSFGKSHSRYREMARLGRALERIPVPTDILVFDREEVKTLRDSLNHVVARALREGKVLYARECVGDPSGSGFNP